MKNRNRLHPHSQQKPQPVTQRHPPKNDHNQANKKRTKNEKLRISKNPYKPSPRLVQPQKSKRTNVQKTPVFCAFLEGAILCDS